MNKLYFLIISVIAVIIVGIIMRKYNRFSISQILIISPALTMIGVIGTKLMGFIESGTFEPFSYYGGVLFLPILVIPLCKLLRIPYGQMMDFSGYTICAVLAIMKIDCAIVGCCGGRFLFYLSDWTAVYFPSQIIESLNGFILMLVLMKLATKEQYKYMIYPFYLILYGITRLILNSFREGLEPFIWIIPNGHLWSLCSIAIGIIALIVIRNYREKEK